MSGRRSAGDELTRWARDLADRIREVVEESVSRITPEVERLLGKAELEKNGFLYIMIPLPGCGKEGISISVKEDMVEVTGSPAEPPYPEAKELQTYSKPIRKLIRLHRRVSPEASEARYVNGILYLKLKLAEAAGVRIEVE
ncbi:MAG TPA: hypothetical protein EYH45_05870 [Candidatus Caldiarchaeum subterraneum]|uniref:Hsp20/alpha crystallin family protein n=1 Tax=Caldiarchaeum subterraneum TaxID=311458 RepID=A0A833EAW1_CALS0|nr:hypothetical protein [Aigarchaeota archaeon]HIQ30075.1 hypothetical protein [Candidatus Caldarchaeum subterraneum]